jgi:ubiquinone/menaquinone biosynthesis C-methylase UbiE
MDWYTNFTQINNDFQIETILKENFQNPKKCKFLELGCGNSTMSFDLYELGYKNITSIDFSSIVIEKMKEKYKNTKINFLVCDFNRMNEMFEKNEFDIIIEKAGLDSIAVKNTPDVPISLFNIYEKMFFVLKNNGIVLSISSKNPQFWKSNVFEELEKKNTAIKKFKQWQKDMTSFNAVKWLEEGIRLVAQDDAELRKKFKVLKNFIKRTERYKGFEESFQRAYDDYCANKEEYDLVFEEEELTTEDNGTDKGTD